MKLCDDAQALWDHEQSRIAKNSSDAADARSTGNDGRARLLETEADCWRRKMVAALNRHIEKCRGCSK